MYFLTIGEYNMSDKGEDVPQLPRKTLLQKAREDLRAAQRIMRQEFHWCKASRYAMINLLQGAITAAEERGYDDNLYTTYVDINALIRHWYSEDSLKQIIANTLNEVSAGILERQLSQHEQLSSENIKLRRAFDALDQAHTILEQALEEKSNLLKLMQTALMDANRKNLQLSTQLAQEEKMGPSSGKELKEPSDAFSTYQYTNPTLREPMPKVHPAKQPSSSTHFFHSNATGSMPSPR